MSVNSQRAGQTIRNWNAVFPVGTVVEYQGQKQKTWSPAGMGQKFEPSVFLVGIQESIPLNLLTVPGWDTHKR